MDLEFTTCFILGHDPTRIRVYAIHIRSPVLRKGPVIHCIQRWTGETG